MSTFVLIHGGGSTAWDWHLVSPMLREFGHEVVAVDLPIEDPAATLGDYVEEVSRAVGDRDDVIVVGHSLGGFTAPLVCERLNASGLVYLAGMIPMPGESFMEWWTNTGHDLETIDSDPAVSFFNDVSDDLIKQAQATERDQQGEWMSAAWPGLRHPAVPTMAIACRDDQFFPLEFMRRQIRERLKIEPTEILGGHYAAISEPHAVATALDSFARNAPRRSAKP